MLLEHQPDAALMRRHVHVAIADDSTLQDDASPVERLEPGDATQRRGLAAAAGAEQATDLARGERKRQAFDGRPRPEAFRDVVQFKRHGKSALRAATPEPGRPPR